MSDYISVRYETIDDGAIARVIMNRPEVRNAQDRRMLAELNDALTRAARDDTVKVIILAGEGPMFSSGHDLKDHERWLSDPSDVTGGFEAEPQSIVGGFSQPGAEGYLALEEEIYFQMCRRWQTLPKPTIAQVHGRTIAGGLMLMWVCDLIIATEDSLFSDPTLGFGTNGVEWFAHPWELGPRKAKEMLFTGDYITAAEAHQLGMINTVVPPEDLSEHVLTLARKIATKSSFALKTAKMAVNQTMDAQGFWTAQQSAFNLHHMTHGDMRWRDAQGDAPGSE